MSLMGDKQEQRVGAGALAIQAKGNVAYQEGLSADEVRTIANLAVKAEFYQLSQMAADVAGGRAQRVCDDFLAKLEVENPGGLRLANEPDFQYTLFAAQKAFALTGNEDLERLLVELLVRRTKEDTQNLRKIVLAESIEVLSKITVGQINSLTVAFVLRRTQNFSVRSLDEFLKYSDIHIKPFVDKMATGKATYRHLQYANCGAVDPGAADIYSIVSQSYPGILQSGFEATEAEFLALSPAGKKLIIPSEYVENKLQVFGKDVKDIHEFPDRIGISREDINILEILINRQKVPADIFYAKLRSLRSYWATLLDVWESSDAKSFNLTSVGIAIGHATLKQQIPDFADLSIWID